VETILNKKVYEIFDISDDVLQRKDYNFPKLELFESIRTVSICGNINHKS